MFGKLYKLLAAIALAIVLAAGGFAGYLFGTGKLSGARVDTIAAVLRGELDQPRDAEPTTDLEAEMDQLRTAPRASTAEEVEALRKREHLESLRLERAERDLEAQRRLLDQVLQTIVAEQEQLAEKEQRFAAQREERLAAVQDEGFQKELEYVTGLNPRQAKEYVTSVWKKQPADVVRLFQEIDTGRGRRILEQFKTPEELQIMTDLLERIRLQGSIGYAE